MITYEGSVVSEEILDKSSGDVRTIICSQDYNGNAAGFVIYLFNELIKFTAIDKPHVMAVRLTELNKPFFFTKDSSEDYPNCELAFYTAVTQAAEDYLIAYVDEKQLGAVVFQSLRDSLLRVNETIISSIINPGGIISYV